MNDLTILILFCFVVGALVGILGFCVFLFCANISDFLENLS
jgi:hypothetical protein